MNSSKRAPHQSTHGGDSLLGIRATPEQIKYDLFPSCLTSHPQLVAPDFRFLKITVVRIKDLAERFIVLLICHAVRLCMIIDSAHGIPENTDYIESLSQHISQHGMRISLLTKRMVDYLPICGNVVIILSIISFIARLIMEYCA